MPTLLLLLLASWLGVGTVQGGEWCRSQEGAVGSYDPGRQEINSELEARLVSRLLPNEVIRGALLAGRLLQDAPQ